MAAPSWSPPMPSATTASSPFSRRARPSETSEMQKESCCSRRRPMLCRLATRSTPSFPSAEEAAGGRRMSLQPPGRGSFPPGRRMRSSSQARAPRAHTMSTAGTTRPSSGLIPPPAWVGSSWTGSSWEGSPGPGEFSPAEGEGFSSVGGEELSEPSLVLLVPGGEMWASWAEDGAGVPASACRAASWGEHPAVSSTRARARAGSLPLIFPTPTSPARSPGG